MTTIFTVASEKGGVGKTRIAYEVAAVLNALLIDMDHHGGGASHRWGHDPMKYQRSQLLTALERGPTGAPPRPLKHPLKPDLIPSHPELPLLQIDAAEVAECIRSWAEALDYEYVVVDTHPDFDTNQLTGGAVAAADRIIVPFSWGDDERAANERTLMRLQNDRDRLAIVPSFVPNTLRHLRAALDYIQDLEAQGLTVAPPLGFYPEIRHRRLHVPLTRDTKLGRRLQNAASEYQHLARWLTEIKTVKLVGRKVTTKETANV